MPEAGRPVVVQASQSMEEATVYGQRNGCRQVGLMALYLLAAMVVTWLLVTLLTIHRDVLAMQIQGAPSPFILDVALVFPAGGDAVVSVGRWLTTTSNWATVMHGMRI